MTYETKLKAYSHWVLGASFAKFVREDRGNGHDGLDMALSVAVQGLTNLHVTPERLQRQVLLYLEEFCLIKEITPRGEPAPETEESMAALALMCRSEGYVPTWYLEE